MHKIMICCPGTSFSIQYIKNLTDLLCSLQHNKLEYKVCTTYSRNIYETRNMSLLGSPEKAQPEVPFDGEDYSHILWIDDDITFKVEDFWNLYSTNLDIVSGLYIMSDNIQYAAVEHWDEDFFSENGFFKFIKPEDIENIMKPFEVSYTGFGFLLIRKGVFEKIGYPWFEPTYVKIKDAEDFSMEDVTFCLKCKKNKIPVHVHPLVRLGHNKTIELKK